MNLLLPGNYSFFLKKGNKSSEKETFKIQKLARKGFQALHLALLISFLYAAMGSANAQTIRYVMAGATGTGTVSWANASGDLQATINSSAAGDLVWVAAGTYLPNRRADALTVVTPNDRNNAFVLKPDVKIYGGFVGNETSLTQRDSTRATNNTLLSGDIGTIGNKSDNAYHVIISAGDVGTAELNGFTISGGNANGSGAIITVNSESLYNYRGGGIDNEFSSPIISNITINGNSTNNGDGGGGIFNNSSSAIISNVTISGNYGFPSGGGIYNLASSPGLTNVIISGNNTNYGGGIFNNSSSPILTKVMINGNTAFNGGGIYNFASSPLLTNVIINGNNANINGGGIYNFTNSFPVLTNVIISGNTAATNGGGMSNASSSPKIRNTIISGNNSGIYNYNVSSIPIISYSLVQGSTDVTNGNIDGNTDPKFVSPVAPGLSTGGDYRLQATSPLINAGSNAYFNAGQTPDLSTITTDFSGNPRIKGGTIDLGAYELQAITIQPDVNGIVYVTSGGNGNLSGSSWANAANDLQLSINATGIKQVWVAAGTYKPSHSPRDGANFANEGRDNTFLLKKDVKIYGGFAGNETLLTQRDSTRQITNTILSGDIGTVGDTSDNVYHVVIGAGDVGTAELNGFTISGGNADGDFTTVNSQGINDYSGGGIYNAYCSPVMSNITISGNNAYYGGGINNYYSYPVLTNLIISANNAEYGGGIYNVYCSPVLTNVIISGNTANVSGGGIANKGSSPVLTNVTISGNSAINGGGIFISVSTPKIRNTIIYGNNSGIYNQDGVYLPKITNSLVQGSEDVTNGNIDGNTDPKFVSPAAAGLNTGGDYRLQTTSPAINVGSNVYFDAGQTPDLSAITTDLDGHTRIQGGTIDLGAYESAVPAAVAGTISGAEIVCSGTNSTTLTLSGYTGTIQWQSSTDNVTFNDIPGATGALIPHLILLLPPGTMQLLPAAVLV